MLKIGATQQTQDRWLEDEDLVAYPGYSKPSSKRSRQRERLATHWGREKWRTWWERRSLGCNYEALLLLVWSEPLWPSMGMPACPKFLPGHVREGRFHSGFLSHGDGVSTPFIGDKGPLKPHLPKNRDVLLSRSIMLRTLKTSPSFPGGPRRGPCENDQGHSLEPREGRPWAKRIRGSLRARLRQEEMRNASLDL